MHGVALILLAVWACAAAAQEQVPSPDADSDFDTDEEAAASRDEERGYLRIEVTGAATIAIAGGVVQAAPLIVASWPCNIGALNGSFTYPKVFHPAGVEVYGSPLFGMLVGNLLVCCAVLVLAGCSVFIHHLRHRGDEEPYDACGAHRFPACVLWVFRALYQGLCIGAAGVMATLDDIEGAGAGVVAIIGLSICFAAPVILRRTFLKGQQKHIVYWTGTGGVQEGDETKDALDAKIQWFMGKGEWVNRGPMLWAQRYAIYEFCRGGRRSWWPMLDLGHLFLVGLSVGIAFSADTPAACGYHKAVLSGAALVMSALSVLANPFCRTRDQITVAAVYFLQAVATGMIAAGHYTADADAPDDVTAVYGMHANESIAYTTVETGAGDVAGVLLFVAAMLTVLKAVADLLTNVVCVHRKGLFQKRYLAWKGGADEDVELIPMDGKEDGKEEADRERSPHVQVNGDDLHSSFLNNSNLPCVDRNSKRDVPGSMTADASIRDVDEVYKYSATPRGHQARSVYDTTDLKVGVYTRPGSRGELRQSGSSGGRFNVASWQAAAGHDSFDLPVSLDPIRAPISPARGVSAGELRLYSAMEERVNSGLQAASPRRKPPGRGTQAPLSAAYPLARVLGTPADSSSSFRKSGDLFSPKAVDAFPMKDLTPRGARLDAFEHVLVRTAQ
eukprot:TRINITY_DN3136_c0_g2_i1.p1 TRINITY_DN3136_c0_g2~~TRINITY_DN3136_c0_g2_i1.p1  ORF type:complete len:673 (+),score=163.66 TRINITY_DN3136_c0_g2_i1:126-2144(+)